MGGLALLFFCLFAEELLKKDAHVIWKVAATFGEHLASAMIVAGIMGLTYEWFVHDETIRFFRELNDDQNKTFGDLIEAQNEHIDRSLIDVVSQIEHIRDAAEALRADEVFKQLIHDMADNRTKIPTLFSPPRDDKDEFVFSTNHEFFQRLVANKTDRARVVDLLRDWLAPGKDAKFRFLASDFVGLLELSELAPELRKRFDVKKPFWASITDAREKSCLLNYAWAASKCETPPYGHLRYLLRTMPADVQQWILFVPRQMCDPELRTMIDEYLETRGATLTPNLFESVIAAIHSLHVERGLDMTKVARTHRHLFKDQLSQRLDEALSLASET